MRWASLGGILGLSLQIVACSGSKGASDGDGTESTDDGATSPTGDDGAGDGTGTGDGGTSAGTTGGEGSTSGDGNSTGEEEEPFECEGNCHYVREAADGAADGSSWEDAWNELPEELERGQIYLIAAGDYSARTLDDPAAGDATIMIRRATRNHHGTDVGWHDEYADGPASFGPLAFQSPLWIFDGAFSRGFEVVGEFQGTAVDIGGDNVVFRNVDVNGAFAETGGQHTDGACTGLGISGSGVTVEGTIIHDVADDGVSASGVQDLSFVGNVVHALHACGTDGDCGPCYNGHSDGLELYDVERSEFVGNLVYDVRSTATLFFGNWADSLGGGPDEYCEDILLANNLFYAPEVGLVAYIQDVAGVRIYHNVFWGVRQGSYGGLSIGQHVTGLYLYNNILLSVNTQHTGGGFDANEHHSDYNLIGASTGQWPEGSHDVVAEDPGFVSIPDANGAPVADPTPEDFALTTGSPAIDAGYAGDASIEPPATDFFGNARDDAPDLGAIEHL